MLKIYNNIGYFPTLDPNVWHETDQTGWNVL